jgi:hypothetical protein
MRYRQLSPTGDFTFGQGSQNYLANSPETVAQAVLTRLKLIQGEWFLDTTAGTPWGSVLGRNTQATADLTIQTVILQTQGVDHLISYSSSVDIAARTLTVSCEIATIYGAAELNNVVVPLP